MASLLSSVVAAASPPFLAGEALSGIFGSISLTAWICLLLPQLITNYKAKSADGLSMGFLFIWLLGDVTNLCGALFTNLAPTAIALASYFCIADLVLISQCTYYNTLNARRVPREAQQSQERERRRSSAVTDGSEEEPLLARRRSSSLGPHIHNGGLPGSHRRHSIRAEESGLDALSRIVTGEDETPDSNPWLHNTVSLFAVYAVGTAGWFVSWRAGAWDSDQDPGVSDPDGAAAQAAVAIIGLILGYASAVCYLCARIPQIVKNYRERSCDGLALLFFLLSLTGNFTYGVSLVAYSQEKDYLVRALPWLLGSLGTIVEDCIIFVQFRLYQQPREPKPTTPDGNYLNRNGTFESE